ncbi:hypothetical protein KL918_000576 [Ogataea parapolymorpha]|uniref:Transcription factor SEF1 n=1 Tax=Ogataea parapolymorpha (strain ATCC 26012 / BCRC 20466 / JCM 22074 / NRRL Y-7560 / DL-1) TaxID=871575 RepID=W1Q874_OGAPD|nr:putative transcription factor SEF1 [Ogataea parapolymorpha DL-1]ESW96619.1 putative transcription factor SEF1 [Ogataea parapolymorpha DL-1]KAG7870372.1 hypothetical protein KL918_000576 [Ogataea parapolymorpha]KAG7875321.1 hypothetical protein KL916_000933 [Ogataea parapolymorpha]
MSEPCKRKLVTLLPNTMKKRQQRAAPKPTTVFNNPQGATKGQPKLRFLKSCARCRKHKIKCNLSETRPNPCSACSRRGHDCHIETVVHVQRSTIIKNIADSIEDMKALVDMLMLQDRLLQNICQERGIKVDGLFNLESISAYPSPMSSHTPSCDESCKSLSIDSCSPVPSDDEYSFDESPCFSLGSKDYPAATIQSWFSMFNTCYLAKVPIMHHISSPTQLHHQSPLLFWTVAYLVSKDADIVGYLKQQLQGSTDIYSIQAIVLLASFPQKHNFDIYSLLQRAREIAVQHELNKDYSPHSKLSSTHSQNIWCLIFVLGTLHSFRLGKQWSTSSDRLLELKKNQSSYTGELVNITLYFSKMLNSLVFDIDKENAAKDNLIQSSLSSWKHQLSSIASPEYQSLRSLLSVIHLTLTLLEPAKELADKAIQYSALISRCRELVDQLVGVDVEQSPIFIKIALDFATLLTLRLSTTPYSSCTKEEQAALEMFVKMFKKLSSTRELENSSELIMSIVHYQTTTVSHGSLYYQTYSFATKLLQGLYPTLNDEQNPDTEDPYVMDAEYRLFQQLKNLDLSNPEKPKPFDVVDVFLRLEDETDTLNEML